MENKKTVPSHYWALTLGVVLAVLCMAGALIYSYAVAFGIPRASEVRIVSSQTQNPTEAKESRIQAQAAWGQFGDYLGGTLNPLVSFFALFILLLTYRSQSEELKATQEALQIQAQTAKQERQEARFFDLLRLYQDTLDEVRFRRRDNLYEGKRAILEFATLNIHLENSTIPLSERIGDSLQSLREFGHLFDHYFRVLFNILKISKDILPDDAYMYVKLLRAQLSSNELTLLALNSLTQEGSKMTPFISQYGLLKHLPKSEFRTFLESELPHDCFGRNFVLSKRQNPSC